jgi:hypothetical protein
MENSVALSPINRSFIASQGIIKGVGSKEKKKDNKPRAVADATRVSKIINTNKPTLESYLTKKIKKSMETAKKLTSKRKYGVKSVKGNVTEFYIKQKSK